MAKWGLLGRWDGAKKLATMQSILIIGGNLEKRKKKALQITNYKLQITNVDTLTLEGNLSIGIDKIREIIDMQECVKSIRISEEVKEYIVDIIHATRYPEEYDIEYSKYLQWGASPRATIGLSLAAKATAMINGRTFVIPNDVRAVAHNVLRHRLVLNYEGKARAISSDDIIDSIIENVPVH